MTDTSGAIRARNDYDPYGRITKVSGDLEADFGFTGFYRHQTTSLNLTLYRAYDADLGRWLSRDPIQEEDGPNLYAYVGNNPLNWIDSYGLFTASGRVPNGYTASTVVTDGKGGLRIHYGSDPYISIKAYKDSVTLHERSHILDVLNENNSIGWMKDKDGNVVPVPDGTVIRPSSNSERADTEIRAIVRQQAFLRRVLETGCEGKYKLSAEDRYAIENNIAEALNKYLLENLDLRAKN